MPIGKAKAPKAPKEKKPKKEKPPKEKKVKKGKDVPEEVDETGQEKKKKFPILMLIPAVVILAAAVIIFVFVLPGRNADKDPEATASVEPVPPVLPTELPVGDEIVPGMVLEADEFAAQAVLAKTITYTYTDLVDAGKAAETYVKQLKTADPRYYVVDEELVRQREEPDYSAAEGLVLMARPLPKPEPETPESAPPEESGEPESSDAPASAPPEEPSAPVEEAPDMVITVRIAWTPGQCVVTADEMLGKITAPPREENAGGSAQRPIGQQGAKDRIESMTPAELGLPGESMDQYVVFPLDGVEMVNDVACIRINIYNAADGSNEFMGGYLMSTDGLHLYRQDPSGDEIEILK